MRSPLALAACAALALLVAGCGKSDCQLLEERLCSCTGASSDACSKNAESLVKDLNPSQAQQDQCKAYLSSCNPPPDVALCEWLRTSSGKIACGLAVDPTSPTTTTP